MGRAVWQGEADLLFHCLVRKQSRVLGDKADMPRLGGQKDAPLAVEQDVRLRGVKSALRYADRVGIELVVIVGERERQAGTALLRDMRSRDERPVAISELPDEVRQALA